MLIHETSYDAQNVTPLTFISLGSRENSTVFFLHLFHIGLYLIYHLPNFLHLQHIKNWLTPWSMN
jgi:hypothetical protein